ncbi:MAG: hypothetical protein ACO1N0_17545 [Fluviicola sp.]
MKQLINSDNYESVYLDYLEGTLSEDERIAFEEFLAANPELQVEEDLVFLDEPEEKMDPLQKFLLKKEDLSMVTNENLDYFAIGKVENVLSSNEEKLFDGYLAANPEAQKVLAAYQETRLQPSVVVYPNKEELKEKEVAFISWKMIGGIAAAAALLLLFFQIGFNGTKEPSENTVTATNGKGGKTKSNTKNPVNEVVPSNDPAQENTTYVSEKGNPKSDKTIKVNSDKREKEVQNQEEKNTPEQLIPVPQPDEKNPVADNRPHQPTILPPVKNDKQPVAPSLNENPDKAPSKDLAVHTERSNMKNPIPVITSALSEKTNTPVDFRTGKATETQKGGFFVKIGKFEISHKSSKRK